MAQRRASNFALLRVASPRGWQMWMFTDGNRYVYINICINGVFFNIYIFINIHGNKIQYTDNDTYIYVHIYIYTVLDI